jgi:Skp family chaperone for outer membrane proteins
MNSLRGYVLAFAAGAVAGVCVTPPTESGADVGPPRPGGQVGFVDVEEVFDKCRRKGLLEKEIEAEQAGFRERMAVLEKEINDAEKQAKLLKPDWNEQEGIQNRLAELRAKGRALAEVTEMKLAFREQELSRALREEIDSEIRAFAAANGFSLILSRQMTTVVPTPGPAGRTTTVRRPVVVYSEKRHNITEAVLERLNAKIR